ncbi:hypothetical protein BC939DRAFT_481421 [Gamsiella multidivaricata]|uniref:uncharacterized protein n=1 Tax=Gamsiella multidivaricata TaxID=101098 RepID=UPI0022203C57|nr:uncharacterized protein BC939DRAFT_481421 [Gamsiella multidivaricata]KAI7817155.1 hypothetical protein BC939DRAFT_481421 [Gamsiella multidivaricata]
MPLSGISASADRTLSQDHCPYAQLHGSCCCLSQFERAAAQAGNGRYRTGHPAAQELSASPNIAIIESQLIWFMSGFDTAVATSAITTVPIAANVAAKFVIAYQFTFHSFNGTHHLIWDTANGTSLQDVLRPSTVPVTILAAV